MIVEVTKVEAVQLKDGSLEGVERFARHKGRVPLHYRLDKIVEHPERAAHDYVFEEVEK